MRNRIPHSYPVGIVISYYISYESVEYQATSTRIRIFLKTELFFFMDWLPKTELLEDSLQSGTFRKRCFRVDVDFFKNG